MAEIYGRQPRENSNNIYNHRLSPVRTRNHRKSHWQTTELYHLKLNKDQPIRSYDLMKPPSIRQDSNLPESRPELYYLTMENNHTKVCACCASPVEMNKKRKSSPPSRERKPEVYCISVEDNKTCEYDRQSPYTDYVREQFKPTTFIRHPEQKKVTLYTIRASPENNSSIHTPLPPIQPFKKKQPVTFNAADGDDKYRVSHKQPVLYKLSAHTRYAPRSTYSKAPESIERSMNRYRFLGN